MSEVKGYTELTVCMYNASVFHLIMAFHWCIDVIDFHTV